MPYLEDDTYEYHRKPYRYRMPWSGFGGEGGGFLSGTPDLGANLPSTTESIGGLSTPASEGGNSSSDFMGQLMSGVSGAGFSGSPSTDTAGLGSLLGSFAPGFLSGFAPNQDIGQGIMGGFSGIGGWAGGLVGSELSKALGLPDVPNEPNALAGWTGLSPTQAQSVMGLAKMGLGAVSPYGPTLADIANLAAMAAQNKNVSMPLAQTLVGALFGPLGFMKDMPVINSVVQGLMTQPLASGIQAGAQALGLAGPGYFGGIPDISYDPAINQFTVNRDISSPFNLNVQVPDFPITNVAGQTASDFDTTSLGANYPGGFQATGLSAMDVMNALVGSEDNPGGLTEGLGSLSDAGGMGEGTSTGW